MKDSKILKFKVKYDFSGADKFGLVTKYKLCRQCHDMWSVLTPYGIEICPTRE